MAYVRPTRVIYIENDPALREILGRLLSRETNIEVVAMVGSAAEALKLPNLMNIDAALIDYSLGQDSLNGLELGIALRAFNEHIGILIYSQYDTTYFAKRIPPSMNHGWGFATKSGSADISEIAKNLAEVAKGMNLTNTLSEIKTPELTEKLLRYGKLTERQRATMKLAALGFAPKAISDQLGISYDIARQELSRAYRILVPEYSDDHNISVLALNEFNAARLELEGRGEIFD